MHAPIGGNTGSGNESPLSHLEAALAPKKARLAALAVVLLATFLVYSHTLLFQFVYDDLPQIVDNPSIHGWSHWRELFRMHVWAQQFSGGTYYRPFFLLLLAAEYSLFKLSTIGWHFVSVLLHVAVTALVYWLGTKFTRTRWASLLAALLFGIYPIHVESVAWVSGVTDPLVTIFVIAAIASYINFRAKDYGRAAWLAASLGLFVCALFTKETAVIILPLLALYEWLYPHSNPRQNSLPGRIAPLLLFLMVFGAYLEIRFLVLHAFRRQITFLPWQAVLYTAPQALWFYVRHLLWPVHLSLMYDLPYFVALDWHNVLLPALVFIAAVCIIVAVTWRYSSSAAKFFAWWLCLPILVVMDFRYFPYGEAVHDRYLYLPSVGLVILTALGCEALSANLPRKAILAAGAGFALLIALLAVATVRESLPWSSNLSLYAHAVAHSPHSVKARNALATEFLQRHLYPQAIAEYHLCLQIDSAFFACHYNLGTTYLELRRFAESEQALKRATEIAPEQDVAWIKLGESRLYQSNLTGAEAAILQALRINPIGRGYHFVLGELRAAQGNYPAALAAYQTEIQLYPDDKGARVRAAEIAAGMHR